MLDSSKGHVERCWCLFLSPAYRLGGSLPKLRTVPTLRGVFRAKRGYEEYVHDIYVFLMHTPSLSRRVAIVPCSCICLFKALPPESTAVKLKDFVETREAFFKLGLVGMAVMLCVGFFSWFNPSEAMELADLFSAFGETLVVRIQGRS